MIRLAFRPSLSELVASNHVAGRGSHVSVRSHMAKRSSVIRKQTQQQYRDPLGNPEGAEPSNQSRHSPIGSLKSFPLLHPLQQST